MRWPPELRIWENGGGIKALHSMEMLQSFWAHLHEVRMLVVERRVEDDLLGRHGGDVAGRNGSHCCLLGVVGWVVVEHLRSLIGIGAVCRLRSW